MACPVKSSEEYVKMVSQLGEVTAMKLFIANGELMPSMQQIDEYINKSKIINSVQQITEQLNSLPENTITKEQIAEITEYAKQNFVSPLLIFKGLDGKKTIDGEKFSAHNIEGYTWGSYSYKDALTYARETGHVAIHIIEGSGKDVVKAPKGTTLSERIKVEEDLVKQSNKDVVELNTQDATTRNSHILFKNPNSIGILNESYPVKLNLPVSTQKASSLPIEKKLAKDVAITILEKLSSRFGLPFKIMTLEEAKDKYPESVDIETKGMFTLEDGSVVMVEENMTWDTPFHEFAHPFLKLIRKQNPALFNSLYDQILSLSKSDTEIQKILDKIKEDYKIDGDRLKEEVIATFIGFEAQGILEGNERVAEPKNKVKFAAIRKLIQQIKEWFIKNFKSIVKDEILKGEIKVVDVNSLNFNTPLREIAKILAIDESVLDMSSFVAEERAEIEADIEAEFPIEQSRGVRQAEPILSKDDKINKALQNVVLSLSKQSEELKRIDRTGKSTKQIEHINMQIAIIQNKLKGGHLLEATFNYIDYANNMTAIAINDLNDIKNEVATKDMDTVDLKKQMKKIAKLNHFISFFVEFDTLAEYVRENHNPNQASKEKLYTQLHKGEITREEFEEQMTALNKGKLGMIMDIKDRGDRVMHEYYQFGLPYMAKVLYKAVDWTKSNSQWKDFAQQIRKIGKARMDVARKHPDYNETLKTLKATSASKEQYDAEMLRLTTEYYEGREMTEESMLELLKENPSDISMWQRYFYDAASVNDLTLSAFVKLTSDSLEMARLHSLKVKRALGIEYEKYRGTSSDSASNVEKFNDPFLEEFVTHKRNEKGEMEEVRDLSFVRNRDYNKFYEARFKFFQQLDKKYATLIPVLKRISEETKSLRARGYNSAQVKEAIWSNQEFIPFGKDYNAYYKEINQWEKENLETRTEWRVYEDGEVVQLNSIDKYIEWKKRNITRIYGDNGQETEFSKQKYQDWFRRNAYKSLDGDVSYKGMELRQPKKSLYTNTKYESMARDTNKKTYYDSLLNQYLADQHKLPMDKRRGYLIPSVEKATMDRFMENGVVNTVKRKVKAAGQILDTQDDYSIGDIKNGVDNKLIPIYYINHVDINNVSRDLLSSVLLFNKMVNRYEALNDLSAEANLLLDIYENVRETREVLSDGRNVVDAISEKIKNPVFKKKGKTDENNSIALLQGFMDMVFYGEEEKKATFNVKGKEFSWNKIAGTLTGYTAIRTLSVNLTAGINNIVLGNIMNFIEGHSGQFYSASNYRKGLAHTLGVSLPNYLQDWGKGKVGNLSKDTQIIELFDMIQGKFDDEYGREMTGSALKKSLKTNTLLFINNAGEFQIQVSNGMAYLFNVKMKNKEGKWINKEGKVVAEEKDAMNLYEALEIGKDGVLKVRDDVGNFDLNKDLIPMAQKMRAVSQRLHGVYNQFGKSQAQRTVLGKLAFLFRRWIVSGARRRFQGMREDVMEGEVEIGNYYGFYNALTQDTSNFLKYVSTFGFGKNDLTDIEKRATKKTMLDLTYMLSAYLVFSILSSMKGEDDEDDWTRDMIAYQARRLTSEQAFFMPPFALVEAGKILRTPSATMSTLEGLYNLAQQSFEPFETYDKKSGSNLAGDSKIWARIRDLIPVLAALDNAENPNQGIKQFTDSYGKKPKD